jgi:hypothetical protein
MKFLTQELKGRFGRQPKPIAAISFMAGFFPLAYFHPSASRKYMNMR